MLDIDVFGPLGGAVVGAHGDTGLVILMEKDGFVDIDTHFAQERTQPDYGVAGVSDCFVLRHSGGLGWNAWLQLAAKVHKVAV